MAPNRRAKNDHHNHGGPQQHQRNGNNQQGNRNVASLPLKCVRPGGCLDVERLIFKEDITNADIEVVRVTCNNMQCDQGNFMHLECFVDWEETVLNFLSSTGRARSWSVKQRLQNLWTKKGYDLAFKACDCNCKKGHLRKDLDWISPMEKVHRAQNLNGNGARNNNGVGGDGAANNGNGNQQQPAVAAAPAPVRVAVANNEVAQNPNNQQNPVGVAIEGEKKKKKKSKAKENLPVLSLSAPVPHPNDNHSRKVAINNNASAPASANSSSSGSVEHSSSMPPVWSVADSVLSAMNRPRVNSLSSNASGSSMAYSGTSGSPPSPGAQFGSPISANSILGQNVFKFQRKNSTGADRVRHNSTGSLFCRRTDFSSFNVLPRQKLNSYHIKMEDDGHGNDDMRTAVLMTLQNQRMTKTHCCLCFGSLVIYDRYPLIDGTFFTSPRKHGKDSIAMNPPPPNCTDNIPRYLSAVCMNCLEGTSSTLSCRWCRKRWDGSSLVLGGCYNFDIFAATPCCVDRLQCTNCATIVVSGEKRPNYFSEFSHPLRCDRCGLVDFHLAKPVPMLFDRYTPTQCQKVC